MKKEKLTIDPQYLINKAGKKTAVILDMKTFENILEYVEDDYFGKQAANILLEDDEVLDFRQVNNKILQNY
jgi:hypothetical protein